MEKRFIIMHQSGNHLFFTEQEAIERIDSLFVTDAERFKVYEVTERSVETRKVLV